MKWIPRIAEKLNSESSHSEKLVFELVFPLIFRAALSTTKAES
jgi:hypothetical protein